MNFSMMIGLAVGIDYSLFIVSRYREEREEGKDAARRASPNTMSTAGKAVFLSALTVVLSLAAVFLVPVMVFRSMALGMILSVVAVAAASLTLLPAVLVALGDRVLVAEARHDPDRDRRGPLGPLDRVGRCAAPAAPSPSASCVLGLLAAPALGMRLGMPGARVVDEGRTEPRRLRRCSSTSFGPGAAAPLFVTVPAADADTVVDAAPPTTPGVVDAQRRRRRPAAIGPRRRARHRRHRRRRPGHLRPGRPAPRPTLDDAVPDAARRWTRRPRTTTSPPRSPARAPLRHRADHAASPSCCCSSCSAASPIARHVDPA